MHKLIAIDWCTYSRRATQSDAIIPFSHADKFRIPIELVDARFLFSVHVELPDTGGRRCECSDNFPHNYSRWFNSFIMTATEFAIGCGCVWCESKLTKKRFFDIIEKSKTFFISRDWMCGIVDGSESLPSVAASRGKKREKTVKNASGWETQTECWMQKGFHCLFFFPLFAVAAALVISNRPVKACLSLHDSRIESDIFFSPAHSWNLTKATLFACWTTRRHAINFSVDGSASWVCIRSFHLTLCCLCALDSLPLSALTW